MGGSDSRRGLDGLTADELAESRRAWWDESFTEVLLRRVPVSTKNLVDVGCGLATAAHTLLLKLPAMTCVGIDVDTERIERATKLLAGARYRHRVELLADARRAFRSVRARLRPRSSRVSRV